jgi:hypothetical protein
MLIASTSGCTYPSGEVKPSVTVTTHYTEPTPVPLPCPTPVPSNTSWNGMFVKLYGNISANPGEHVYGTVKVNYLDKNYWDDQPTAHYDTETGGTYSLDVRAKVPFKLDIGYLYMGQQPQGYMLTKRVDQVYTIDEDTPLDFEIMTSNITPKN